MFNLLMLSWSLLLPHPTLLFPILLSLVLLNLMVPTILVGYLLLFLFFIAMMMVIIDASDPCPSKFLHDALDEGGNPCWILLILYGIIKISLFSYGYSSQIYIVCGFHTFCEVWVYLSNMTQSKTCLKMACQHLWQVQTVPWLMPWQCDGSRNY